MQKNICIVCTNLTSINVFLKEIIIQLSKKYNVTIISKYSDEKLLKHKNIKYKFIPIRRKVNFFYDFISLFHLTFYFLFNKCDLCLSLTPKAGLLAAISGFISQIKVRIHYYTGQVWITKKGLYKIFLIGIDKLIFLLNTYNLVDSKGQFAFLIKKRIINKNKCKVIANGTISGIDTEKYKFDVKNRIILRKELAIKADAIVILYVGRFVRDKGIIELISNFKKIRTKYKNCFLVLIGSDEERLLANLRKKNFKFKNIITMQWKKDIASWYSIADIYCLPSFREGLGLSVLEAAASSIPSICSNIYGLQDCIVDNKTGLYFDINKKNDLKRKLIKLIKNKNIRQKFGLNSRKYVLKNFQKNFVIKEFIDFIDLQLG